MTDYFAGYEIVTQRSSLRTHRARNYAGGGAGAESGSTICQGGESVADRNLAPIRYTRWTAVALSSGPPVDMTRLKLRAAQPGQTSEENVESDPLQ